MSYVESGFEPKINLVLYKTALCVRSCKNTQNYGTKIVTPGTLKV